ncbi:MAG: AtpZ/AtpI family protein [Gemmataceae bacterium]
MAQDSNHTPSEPDLTQEMSEVVGSKEERKLLAREEKSHTIWFGLGMMGVVGWSVAIPTLLGVALGSWLDAKTDTEISWTLTGLIGGVVLGCWNAWYWVKRQSEKR